MTRSFFVNGVCMSSLKNHRDSAEKRLERTSLVSPISRLRSSDGMRSSMESPHNFMEYKIENSKIDQTEKILSKPVNNRNEPRHSLTSIAPLTDNISTSSPMSVKETIDFDTDDTENTLPLKTFDGTKRGIIDVSQQSRSYFWLRRIKEIFLKMGTIDEPFVAFDMELARADMLTTCDIYLRHDFNKLKNKV